MVEKKMKQAQKLIQDIDKKIYNWNERSMFTIKGVKNLSRADMDIMKMYAEHFIRQGGNFYGLMDPMGSMEEVMAKYEII